MIGYASDTWGISGPRFLALYAVLAAAALSGALYARWTVRRDGDRRPTGRNPDPAGIAYLNHGPLLAVYSSVAALRAAGAFDRSDDGNLTATGSPPHDASGLDRAVHHAVGRGVTVARLRHDSQVAQALHGIRDDLVRAGLLYPPARRRRLRAGGLAVLAVAALGVVRMVAGLSAGKPIGYLTLLTFGVGLVAVTLVKVPRTTPHATRLVTKLRAKNRHLSPDQSPSWALYGASGAALGVALFGPASVWAADPAFAHQAGLPQQALTGGAPAGSAGGGCSTGSSSCGGSGCGGGGCGG